MKNSDSEIKLSEDLINSLLNLCDDPLDELVKRSSAIAKYREDIELHKCAEKLELLGL